MLNTNLTLNLKIFHSVLSHIHGNYKQDTENEFDLNIGSSVFCSDLAHFNRISKFDQIFILIFPFFLTIFLVEKDLFIGI